ncbi:DUF4214 domain-containing protein [Oxalobacteraceae bacterium A2-2]
MAQSFYNGAATELAQDQYVNARAANRATVQAAINSYADAVAAIDSRSTAAGTDYGLAYSAWRPFYDDKIAKERARDAAAANVTTTKGELDVAELLSAAALTTWNDAQGLTIESDALYSSALSQYSQGVLVQQASVTRKADITRMMVALGHPPAVSEMVRYLTNNFTMAQIAAELLPSGSSLSDTATLIDFLYNTVLGRSPELAGKAWWMTSMRSYTSVGEAAYQFVLGSANELDGTTRDDKIVRSKFGTDLKNAWGDVVHDALEITDPYSKLRTSVGERLAATLKEKESAFKQAETEKASTTASLRTASLNAAVVADNLVITFDSAKVAQLTTSADSTKAVNEVKNLLGLSSLLATSSALATAVTQENLLKQQLDLDVTLQGDLTLVQNAQKAFSDRIAAITSATPAQGRDIRIAQVYVAMLGRGPTAAEQKAALELLSTKFGYDELATSIRSSNPGAYPGSLTNEAFVKQVYLNITGHELLDLQALGEMVKQLATLTRGDVAFRMVQSIADVAGRDTSTYDLKVVAALTQLAAQLNTGTGQPSADSYLAANALALRNAELAADSDAAATLGSNQDAKTVKRLTQLYTVLLGRAPDASGLSYWTETIKKWNMPASDLAYNLLNSMEAYQRIGSLDGDQSGFVQRVFSVGLGRAATADEIAKYAAQLHYSSVGEVILNICDDVAGYNGNDLGMQMSKLLLNAKVNTALAQIATERRAYAVSLGVAKPVVAELLATSPDYRYMGPAVNISTITSTLTTPKYDVDRWGNVLSVVDVRYPDLKTTYTYDANNQVTSKTLPVGGRLAGGVDTTANYQIKQGYDQLGRLVSSTDANGNTSKTVYDANGHVVKEVHADGGLVISEVDALGQVKSVWQSMTASDTGPGVKTSYEYDRLGHVLTATTGNVKVYTSTYAGKQVTLDVGRDAAIVNVYTYDELGRRTSLGVRTSDSNSVTVTAAMRYDAAGHVIASRDQAGKETISRFDVAGHELERLDAKGGSQRWSYNTRGQLVTHMTLDQHPITLHLHQPRPAGHGQAGRGAAAAIQLRPAAQGRGGNHLRRHA